jgi:hypothetical protein
MDVIASNGGRSTGKIAPLLITLRYRHGGPTIFPATKQQQGFQ